MITNFLVALMIFFGVSFGQVDNDSSKGKSHKDTAYLNKQINDLYSKGQEEISNFLDKQLTHKMYYPLWELVNKRSLATKDAIDEIIALDKAGKLPNPLLMMNIPSYLHMICNSVFLNKQRVHEMVVYDFLYKYYSKQLYSGKKNAETVKNEEK